MTTLPQLSNLMKSLLTTTADRLGVQTGFCQRAATLSPSIFARTLLFSWWQFPAATCQQRASMAQTLGVVVSPQAIDQRFSPRSAAFMHALLGAAVQQAVCADPVNIPLLQRFAHVEIADGSVITLPASLAEVWPGCGHAQAATTAALKLGLRFDLSCGCLRGPIIAAARSNDRRVVGDLEPLPPGSLHVADLGFFALEQFARWAAEGSYWLSRYRVGVLVFDEQGQQLDLPTWLAQHCSGQLAVPIRLGAVQLPVQLIAERVPQAVCAERRRAIRADASARQREISAAEWELAAWTILLTNCTAELMSIAEALALGQARWQVELLFKRWKSLGQVDEWRTQNQWRILTEVYAKLLVIVLQHWLLVVGCWARADRSLWRGQKTLQQCGYSLARGWVLGAAAWAGELAAQMELLARCRIDKRSKEPSTYQRLLAASPPAVQF